MNKILRIKKSDDKETSKKEIEKFARQFALPLQKQVIEAFRLADEEKYEEAAGLCCRILDEDDSKPDIMELLGQCYFAQGNMAGAAMVFHELVEINPENAGYHCSLGMAYHGIGEFEEAVKQFKAAGPMGQYRPFYYTSYGDCLQKIGKEKESREMFGMELDRYVETGEILLAELLDGVFQNVLYLDISLANGKYKEDLELYLHFLSRIEMTEKMQENLASTVVYLSTQMRNKWYRPLFRELIDYISRKNYLRTEGTKETLKSAFIIWESYRFHDDRKVSKIMDTGLNAIYNIRYTLKDIPWTEDREDIQRDALISEWNLCRYVPGHLEEIKYIQENYPYNYECSRKFLERVKHDPEQTAKEVLEELQKLSGHQTLHEWKVFLEDEYSQMNAEGRAEVLVDGWEPYRRKGVKVGRNDPCPCGSGKKYKKCCGK